MSKQISFVLIVLTAAVFLFSFSPPAEDDIRVVWDDGVIISVEHYRARNGMTPLRFCLGEMELHFRMDTAGRVTESGAAAGLDQPVFTLHWESGYLTVGEHRFPFVIAETGMLRTRLRLEQPYARLTMAVNGRQPGVTVTMGSTPLAVKHLRASVREVAPGVSEVVFEGASVLAYADFVYDGVTGQTAAVPHVPLQLNGGEPDGGPRVWSGGER